MLVKQRIEKHFPDNLNFKTGVHPPNDHLPQKNISQASPTSRRWRRFASRRNVQMRSDRIWTLRRETKRRQRCDDGIYMIGIICVICMAVYSPYLYYSYDHRRSVFFV